jgi:phosphomannomutase
MSVQELLDQVVQLKQENSSLGRYLNDRLPSRRKNGSTLILFDVDGTLAVPAQLADPEIVQMLAKLRENYTIGIVGAGDYVKQQRQLGGGDMKTQLDFVFSENGVHAFRQGTQIHLKSIVDQVGQDRWPVFERELDALLAEHAEEIQKLLELAAPGTKLSERGTFLEKRMCTVNICPIGRTPGLSKEARAAFEKVDKEAGFRDRFVAAMVKKFGEGTEYNLQFSIGGQIGIDTCPCGWDKTFCLQFISAENFPTIHFFGDKTHEGGGDHEIYEHPRTIGHQVHNAEDTLKQVTELFVR